jgi:FAD:protein FMN transferase
MGTVSGQFFAMGCVCRILFDTEDRSLARALFESAKTEALRIEKKFSRYLEGNIVHQLNTASGNGVKVDEETANLLDFADVAWRQSGGLFDITSGVLRRAWRFNGSDRLPSAAVIEHLLPSVGWQKADWRRPVLQLQSGMEIDLGGLGKEYAVDRALAVIREKTDIAVLVDFGGDIAVSGRRRDGVPWTIGIEPADQAKHPLQILHVTKGAVTTSGNSKKFVVKNGRRYGHILDPRSGWPVPSAPQTVTVAAGTCTEAGFFSTWGMLSGDRADRVLTEAGVRCWCSM